MTSSPIDLDQLIHVVEGRAELPLDRLGVASELADELGVLADDLRQHFVAQCRQAGSSWEEVGMALRVTRQAAQRRFVGPLKALGRAVPGQRKTVSRTGRERVVQDGIESADTIAAMAQLLVNGPLEDLAGVPRATGGAAGVFTIWYRGTLLFLGHARNAAGEAKESNWRQADGARGRLAGIRRQPPASIQRALRRFFLDDIRSAAGSNDQKKAAALLSRHAKYRAVETASGPDAVQLYGLAKQWLPEHGYRVLADEVS